MKKFTSEIVLGSILLILIIVMIIVLVTKKDDEVIKDSTELTGAEVGQTLSTSDTTNKENIKKSMQEGGLICQYEDKVTLANGSDIYLIEKNEQKSKIATLEIEINNMYFDGENIYCLPEYGKGQGIYKVDLQGNIQKIYNDITLQINLTEDSIYFVKQVGYDEINQNPQGSLCKMNKDGSNITEIASSIKNYFYIENNKIFYTTQDRKMYSMNLDGTNTELLQEGRKFALGVCNQYLIYIDYANQELTYAYNIETKEETQIGMSGEVYEFLGQTYIVTKTTAENLEEQYTISKFDSESGKIEEIYKAKDLGENILYINKDNIYYKSPSNAINSINIENKQEENSDLSINTKFIGNSAYEIEDESNIKIINLSTNEEKKI